MSKMSVFLVIGLLGLCCSCSEKQGGNNKTTNCPIDQGAELSDQLRLYIGKNVNDLKALLGEPLIAKAHFFSWTNSVSCSIDNNVVKDIRFGRGYEGILPEGVRMGQTLSDIVGRGVKFDFVCNFENMSRASDFEKGVHFYVSDRGLYQVILTKSGGMKSRVVVEDPLLFLGQGFSDVCDVFGVADVINNKKYFAFWTHEGFRVWTDEKGTVEVVQLCAPYRGDCVPGVKLGMSKEDVAEVLKIELDAFDSNEVWVSENIRLDFQENNALIRCTKTKRAPRPTTEAK